MTPVFPHQLDSTPAPRLGLIVLQADETIEMEARAVFPARTELFVSRVPSGDAVTPDTLAAMQDHLAAAAALFPRGAPLDAVAYACTSGAATIGPERVAAQVRAGVATGAVTDPLSALVAACSARGLTRLALLSPYRADVSDTLRRALAERGIATPVFGSFDVAEEARVVRIDAPSIHNAARALVQNTAVQALFISCTNLRTQAVLPALESELQMPVLSSNSVLFWHMSQLAAARGPSR